MIAAKNKTVARSAQDRLHAAAVSFNSRGPRIVKAAAMNCSPEVRVKLEIGATPLSTHRPKQLLKMFLHFRVRAVQYVPWTTSPAAERDSVRTKRFPSVIFHKPIRVLLENVRLLFSDKWSNPDRRLKSTMTNLLENVPNVSAKS